MEIVLNRYVCFNVRELRERVKMGRVRQRSRHGLLGLAEVAGNDQCDRGSDSNGPRDYDASDNFRGGGGG